ncbi:MULTISPECIES: type VI secretion system Vgr family protein [Acinetobacter]|uniref:Type VI secretion system tip protein VgrG n=1 Tax=Acinetobacter johnsonii TaxID=40214 RepID=A0AAW6RRQ8_ACIJO|nr:type VI secretion system Vgr family protein [Acinetobacter johnsonii]MDG9787105.1 type VI secretion system tip protein VgrG [Acinetobacter johnsonii]MDG9800241.1 type VI secretion system tip protein VgrG [Acinetobacter johnsonii]MDH1241320.1 type VI secretion system tip protein VgrG [Acinetobacter johnsonii]RZN92511.1 type VI secretion system tip protein VgrG [Acinetobacter johnsonii]
MFNSIYKMLESFGFGSQKRAVHIHFSNLALNTQVFIQRIEGEHRINQGLKAEILCLSTNAYLPLKQFIGGRVAVDQVTDVGQLSRLTGVITSASQGQSDGALTVYKLTIEDATTLWHKRRNSRVFMSKSVREITEILFSEWQSHSTLFAASLSLNLEGLSRDYDVRPFVMQSNETDAEFLTRLWRSEGINWLIDEQAPTVLSSSEPIQAQQLRLMDDNQAFTALGRRKIRFHCSHATEPFDSITSFIAERHLQSTTVQTQRWQAQHLAQDQSQAVLSAHQHSDQQDNESLGLEQAWCVSPAWTADLQGEDQATSANSSQLDRLNQQLNQYHELQAKYFTAKSSVRDAQVGYWFEMVDHPEIEQHVSAEREFLILGKVFYNQNNLPKELLQQINLLLKVSRWQGLNEERQANELFVVRREVKIVPEYQAWIHRPAAYPLRAKVVGPEGEEIYVDAWGRIKVRFMFTRSDDHAHDGGAGANDNDTDSAWVDVLTPWAGEGYGVRFHPRVGEIVVIDFFEGDVDRPFVVGRIHEAERHQTMFDVKGTLPATKKLSGIRSQEVAGQGFNQLRFDDTTGQISVQLHSSHGASQLNLGNLSHPKETENSDGRGEGFELRTDQWGAMRAGKGLLISTYAQDQAVADHLAASEAQSILQQGHDSMHMLSTLAVKQQTDALNVINRLPKLIQSVELKGANQALQATVGLFKTAVSQDPISALKTCGGFIEDIQKFGQDTDNLINEFKDYFQDAEASIENLKAFIDNLEEHGTDALKSQLQGVKDKLNADPLGALKDVGKVIANVDMRDFDLTSACGSFNKGSKLDVNPMQALVSMQGFMETYAQEAEQTQDTQNQAQAKIFRQALMLLASPNGIALTTPEDIVLQASQDIAESAQGSINLSAQKNIIAHAQDKVSLFAAQKGLKAFAAKGKVELQAQDDAIEAIARKVIKLISTEDKIEITSPKEIVLTAGGSQLKINGDGIFTTTGGKFESKAGQHSFVGGAKVSYEVPELPSSGPFTKLFHFVSLEGEKMENAMIQIYEKINENYVFKLDSKIDKSIFRLENDEKNIEYKALVGFDDWVSWFDDEEEELQEEIDLGEHHNPYDKESGNQYE